MRVLVVEDEAHAARRLATLLALIPDLELVGIARDAEQAMALIQTARADLGIFDINLPGATGLELAARIPEDLRPLVVFATAYDEHAISAFDVGALDYLLKPVEGPRLLLSIERARAALARGEVLGADRLDSALQQFAAPPGMWVKTRQGAVRVAWADVDWLEADGDYVQLHVGTCAWLVRRPLHMMERSLDPRSFVRVHRSAIVNVHRLRGVCRRRNGSLTLTLTSGSCVPVGPSYKSQALAMWGARSPGNGE